MKVRLRVYPSSKKEKVEFLEDQNLLKVWTAAPPVDGKANTAVIQLVAKYIGLNKKFVQIRTGITSKNKIIEILTDFPVENLVKKPRLF